MRLTVDNLKGLRGAFHACEQFIACVDATITVVNTVAIPKGASSRSMNTLPEE